MGVFALDANGNRLSDAQGHLLAETTASGAPLRTYVWRENADAGAEPTPQVVIDHTASGPDGHPLRLYLQTDHLGSPIAARDHAGRLVWAWHSDAFGASAPDEDPDGDGTPTAIHLRFPGQYFDAESALHYNWHRYYDPTTGRYLSPDPIGVEGGSNLFGYVGGNPLSYVDPRGLDNPGIGPYGPGPNRGDGSSGFMQVGGAVGDFLRNYQNMRNANTVGGDKYFHCMANCQATRRGPAGESTACTFSGAREWTDQHIKGDPASSSFADQAANAIGRSGALSSSQSCGAVCSGFRPNGLPGHF